MNLKLPEEPFDPKLKLAMEQIKPILAQHDIAAIVMLQSQNHAEFLLEVSPTWSCAKVEELTQGVGIRVRALRKDYPTLDAWREKVRLTVSMLCGFSDLMRHLNDQVAALLEAISSNMEIEHIGKLTLPAVPECPTCHSSEHVEHSTASGKFVCVECGVLF